MPAPIAFFVYRRPDHVRRTIAALAANPEAANSVLYVFSDGARDSDAAGGVAEVRAQLPLISGFYEVKIVLRERNLGLARNITSGVSAVLAEHGSVIVVEDDVMAGPHFLRFMNDALKYYADEPRVGSISGYCYPVRTSVPETFFIKGADCWGWATWCDRWAIYEPDGTKLLTELRSRGLTHAFDFDGTMGYTQMLMDWIAGRNDSWAVRWHASCFLRDLLILYPGRSMVQNIGQDGSGTHSQSAETLHQVELAAEPVSVGGIAVEESAAGRAAFCDFFRRSQPSEPAWRQAVQSLARKAGLRPMYRWLKALSAAGNRPKA